MRSHGDSVLESGGPLRCSRTARRLSSLVRRRRTRFCGPCQVALRISWPKSTVARRADIKRKTGRSENEMDWPCSCPKQLTMELRSTRSTSPCPIRQPLQSLTPLASINTGKNALHLIGLDDQGAIVLREKIARGRIAARAAPWPSLRPMMIPSSAACAGHRVTRID
jgi:hypothetical protein